MSKVIQYIFCFVWHLLSLIFVTFALGLSIRGFSFLLLSSSMGVSQCEDLFQTEAFPREALRGIPEEGSLLWVLILGKKLRAGGESCANGL